jgi:SAM-dependent methyltransferase
MTFDEHAEDYEQIMARALAFTGAEHDWILAAKAEHLLAAIRRGLGTAEGLRVLDVGCGVGALERWLKGDRRRLCGAEVSLPAILRARREHSDLACVSYGGERLPFANGSFDVVFASCVLHHVPPEARRALVSEMARATRSGGIVVLVEHNPWNPVARWIVSRCELDDDAVLLSSREACALLAAAGLDGVEARFMAFSPWQGRIARRVEARLSALPLGAQYVASGRSAGRGKTGGGEGSRQP